MQSIMCNSHAGTIKVLLYAFQMVKYGDGLEPGSYYWSIIITKRKGSMAPKVLT